MKSFKKIINEAPRAPKPVHRIQYDERHGHWLHSQNGGFTWKKVEPHEARAVNRARFDDIVSRHPPKVVEDEKLDEMSKEKLRAYRDAAREDYSKKIVSDRPKSIKRARFARNADLKLLSQNENLNESAEHHISLVKAALKNGGVEHSDVTSHPYQGDGHTDHRGLGHTVRIHGTNDRTAISKALNAHGATYSHTLSMNKSDRGPAYSDVKIWSKHVKEDINESQTIRQDIHDDLKKMGHEGPFQDSSNEHTVKFRLHPRNIKDSTWEKTQNVIQKHGFKMSPGSTDPLTHPTPAAYFHHDDGREMSMKYSDGKMHITHTNPAPIKEDAMATNAVGTGNIAGANGDPPGPTNKRKLIRRIKPSDMGKI